MYVVLDSKAVFFFNILGQTKQSVIVPLFIWYAIINMHSALLFN